MADDRNPRQPADSGTGPARQGDMNDDWNRGGASDEVRGVADEGDEDFEDTEDLEEDEEDEY